MTTETKVEAVVFDRDAIFRSAEALRDIIEDMRMCKSGGPEHVYLRVTQWIRELESLLGRGG